LALGYDPSAPERDLACSSVDDAGTTPKCLFTNEDFQWEDDQPLRHPWSKTIIYETHVRGFTIQANSGVKHPGTYRGLTHDNDTTKGWYRKLPGAQRGKRYKNR
jgi:isoamylase